jgi:hypothetical protein
MATNWQPNQPPVLRVCRTRNENIEEAFRQRAVDEIDAIVNELGGAGELIRPEEIIQEKFQTTIMLFHYSKILSFAVHDNKRE